MEAPREKIDWITLYQKSDGRQQSVACGEIGRAHV